MSATSLRSILLKNRKQKYTKEYNEGPAIFTVDSTQLAKHNEQKSKQKMIQVKPKLSSTRKYQKRVLSTLQVLKQNRERRKKVAAKKELYSLRVDDAVKPHPLSAIVSSRY